MKNSGDLRIKSDQNTGSTTDQTFARSITMDELLCRFPRLIPVLNRNKVHCVGCLLARFHDISDAAYEHGLDEDELYEKLLSTAKE